MDQHNAFRTAIESGAVVLGGRTTTISPTVIEVYGDLGLDFVWVDFEHAGPSPYDGTLLEHLARAAEVGGTELLVRLPTGDPALIRKALDAGVRNLLVPRVDSADEVRRAVKATRFEYDGGPGERGKAGARASTWGSAEAYVQTEDQAVYLGAMIEKATAVAALDEILAVPELGFAFIGPSDLSVQLGYPTARNHPAVEEQIATIRDRCRDSGVPVGCVAHDPNDAVEAIQQGYQIVRIGGEVEAARKTLRDRLEQIDPDGSA